MKNINIKLISLLILVVSSISCKSQVFPLDTDVDNIPPNAQVKDLYSELNPYVGNYKANFDGKEITLFITKVENKLEKSTHKNYYMDALVIKYIVKTSFGTILQDTQNYNYPKIEFYSIGTIPTMNTIEFYYSGTNCNVGWGDVYLKKLNDTQINWEYLPDSMVLTDENCPGNPDVNIYLPKGNLIFTKQ